MKEILFAWRRFTPPMFLGGAEISRHLMAEELVKDGWSVTYLGSYEHPRGLPPYGSLALNAMRSSLGERGIAHSIDDGAITYSSAGIRCIATSQQGIRPAFSELLKRRPHRVFIAQEGADSLACQAKAENLVVVGVVHSVSQVGLEVLNKAPDFALVPSRFVADKASRNSPTRLIVMHAAFRPAPFAQPFTSDRSILLYINPVAAKGSEFLRHLAIAMPRRHFLAVEAWGPADITDLPNLRILPRQWDLTAQYNSARILLVPSVVEDAFPRVVIEAGLHGVPTVGSNRGGIPEAVGQGGMCLPLTLSAWQEAIESLDDTNTIISLSELAKVNAERYTRPLPARLRQEGVL